MKEPIEEQGWKSAVSNIKDRSLSRLDSVRSAADRSLHQHPVLWAGAAAGAGLAVGLAGRMLRRRREEADSEVFIIEGC